MSFFRIKKENILRNVIKAHPKVKIEIFKGKSACNIRNIENIIFSNIVYTNIGEYLYSFVFYNYRNTMYLPII